MSTTSTGLGKNEQAKVVRATYSMREVRILLGIGHNAVYAAAKDGTIPTIRIGKSLRSPKAFVDAMLGIKKG